MKSCPNPDCQNSSEIPLGWPNAFYRKHGTGQKGQQVYQCKKCGKTFVLPESDAKDLKESLELDKAAYKLLVNGYSTQDIIIRLDVDADYLRERIECIEKRSHFYEHKILVSQATTLKNTFSTYLIQGKTLVSIEPISGYIVTFKVIVQPTPIVITRLEMDEIDSVEELAAVLKSATRKAHAYKVFLEGNKDHNIEELNIILNILRIHLNYQVRSNQKMTPAMALNLTDKRPKIVDILTAKET